MTFKPKFLLFMFSISFILAACSPIKILNAQITTPYEVDRAVSFGEHPRQKLDIYTPKNVDHTLKPTIVWIYGGSWKEGRRQDYQFIAHWLTNLGHRVVIPDYRVYPDVKFPDFLIDNAKAIAKINDTPKGIVVMGHSAGAYNAAMMAFDHKWLRAEGVNPHIIKGFVGLSGPYDFYPYDVDSTINTFGHVDDPNITQPVHLIREYAPETLLLHGAEDDLVYPRNATALKHALEDKDHNVEYLLFDGVDHVKILTALSPLLRKEKVTKPIEEFLEAF